jgi:DNA polymerase-3 subunit gamma/tau
MADQDYLVTARKYRPSLFKEVVAQEHVTDTLKNALRLDRVAHAYLFSGPRGVGKTTAARILAKAINCETPREEREDAAEPCCACPSCRSFEEGGSLNVFELDAASNRKVADVEPLLEKVTIPPQGGRKKVYIIDEVHMFSKTAFNALLKTLEEPPDHALFIFATTEPNKVLPTVRSRCQRFDFRRIPVPEVVGHLRTICETEGIEADEESLMLLARKGNGALRDALSAFDQAISLCGTTLTYDELTQALGVVDQDLYFDLTEHVATQDTAGVLTLVRHVVRSGYDLQEFLVGLAEHLRNLLVARSLGGEALEEVAASTQATYAEEAGRFGEADLLRLLSIVGDAEEDVKNSPQPRLKLETTLLQMAQMRRVADLREVLQKIDRLEQMAEEGDLPASLPEHAATTGAEEDDDTSPSTPSTTTSADTTSADAGTASSPAPAPDDEAATSTAEEEAAPAPETEEEDDQVREPTPPLESDSDAESTTEAPTDDEEDPPEDDPDPPPPPDDTDPSPPDDSGPDAPDDGGVQYDDVFGTPALDDEDDEDEPTDAQGHSGSDGAAPDGPSAQATAVAEPQAATGTAEGVAQQWPQVVETIRDNHIRLGIFLGEAEPVALQNEVLTVSVPKDLHRDTLRGRRRVLLDCLARTVDVAVEDVEFVVEQPAPDENGTDTSDEPLSPREQLRNLRDTYASLDVLFEEFGAEPVW